jgi:hypothetical protein
MLAKSTVRSLLLALALAMVPTAARAGEITLTLPTPASSPPPLAPELGAPRLHIESDFPITLHEVEPFAGDEIVCQAPCSRVVDGRAGQRFYFAGDEIPPSPSFALAEKNGDVLAAVHKGNFALLTTGRALVTPAVLHLIAGAVLVPFLALERDPGTALDLQYATGATLGVGAALLVTSVVMLVEGRTSFRFNRL